MDIKDNNFNNICSLIYSISKLDVEYIDSINKSSFRLIGRKMPSLIEPIRKQTALFIYEFLKDKTADYVLYHTNSFSLSYLGVGLWEEGMYSGAIIVGPFLSDFPDHTLISSIIINNKLSLSHFQYLEQYYKAITILDSGTYKNIGNMMVNLTTKPLIPANITFSVNSDFTANPKDENVVDREKLYSEIEARYRVSNELMNAIEKGLKEDALRLSNYFKFNPSHRIPNNPLRACKNLAFSFSAMLKGAAERGGVAPVYLHNISDKFAILIEKVSSIEELESLKAKMISEYCDLINNYSTAGYSPNIRKAINYINLNFDSDLSLNLIAEKVNLNPSHLSRQFRKETNLTITEFINRKRIAESKLLIKQNHNSITEIAQMVGFSNHNYFNKVFKQMTSLTPKEYLRT